MFEILRPLPFARLRLLVFDLDGTLIDSKQDLANSVNAMLTALGRATLPHDVIGSYIGDGAGMLVRRALGDPRDEQLVASALELFLEHYREHKLDHTYVYEGVLAALHALEASSGGATRKMAVLTNKPVVPSQQICDALGLAPYFFKVYGGNSFSTKKPDPAGLRTLMEEGGAGADETVMIGDSETDILTARAAGAWSIGCRYGLSPHTVDAMREQGLLDAVVSAPAEWLPALGAF